jgi:predicted amidohydrolase
MESKGISRRHFLGKSAATAGMVTMGSLGQAVVPGSTKVPGERLPREVWIGSLSQMNMTAATSAEMVDKVIRTLDQIMVCKPDVVSLPEVFPFWGVEKKYPAEERVKESQNALEKLSGFSKKNNCYSVCPVYTSEKGKLYNAAVIFDRKGEKTGEYRKAHLTEGEIANGLTPGRLILLFFKPTSGSLAFRSVLTCCGTIAGPP